MPIIHICCLRSSVQLFLSGSSLSRSVSLGDVDWRLDPGILGLDRETDYTLEYRSAELRFAKSIHINMYVGYVQDRAVLRA